MHLASLLSIPDKISTINGSKHMNNSGWRATWADNRVLFSRCRCEHSHHWTLSTFHLCISQLMEPVEVALHFFFFFSKIEDMSHIWIAIWKLAAALLCPNPQVSQRIYLAMQISREEIWGSVQQVSLGAWIRGQEHFISVFQIFIHLPDWTQRLPLAACANRHYANECISRQS